MKTRDILTLAVLAVLPFSALFCAGTSETGNAAMLTGAIIRDAQPVACAAVRLVADGFIPGTNTKGKVFSTTTNSEGRYTFADIPAGDYYLNAEKDGERVLRGPFTLEASKEDPTEPMVTDTLKKVASITLTIPEDKEVTVVYIEGMEDSWEVTSGTVTIDNIPAGTVIITGLTSAGGASVPQTATTVEVTPADTIATVIGNRPPVIVSTGSELSVKITESPASYSTTINAYDPESGVLTFSLIDGPEGLELNETTGRISWQLSSNVEETVYKVGVLVSDPDGGTRSVWWNISFFWSTPDENQPPVITLIGGNTVTVQNGDTGDSLDYYLTAISVVDPEGDEFTVHNPVHNVNVYKDSCYIIRYSATDEVGNTGKATRSVCVVTPQVPDTVPPILTLTDTVITVMKGSTFTPPQYSAYDVRDGVVTGKVIIEGTVDTDVVGPYAIEYSITDAAGNKTVKTVRVPVVEDVEVDTVAPLITLLGNDTMYIDTLTDIDQLFDLYVEPGYTAFDNRDGDLTPKVTASELSYINDTEWECRYTVHDEVGNYAYAHRTIITNISVIIDPPRAPVIILSGKNPDTVIVGSGASYFEPGYTATDEMDGEVTADVTISGAVDMNTLGKYTLVYRVKDEAGNTGTATRIVYVIPDTTGGTPPIIELAYPDSVIEVPLGGPWIEPGFVATDRIDLDITVQVIVDSSEVVDNLSTVGLYSVVYTVTNSRGIKSVVVRNVRIVSDIDITKPVITLLGRNPDSVALQSSSEYPDPGATAVDDRDGDITANIMITGEVDMNSIGQYYVNYRVEDAAGWIGTATRTVRVIRDTLKSDFFTIYDVPSPDPLPTVNKIYTQPEVDGDGPSMFDIDSLLIQWNQENGTLDSLYIFILKEKLDLLPGSEHSLQTDEPWLKITNTRITGLDNTYYVTIDGDELIWVEQEGTFAIIWKEVE